MICVCFLLFFMLEFDLWSVFFLFLWFLFWINGIIVFRFFDFIVWVGSLFLCDCKILLVLLMNILLIFLLLLFVLCLVFNEFCGVEGGFEDVGVCGFSVFRLRYFWKIV